MCHFSGWRRAVALAAMAATFALTAGCTAGSAPEPAPTRSASVDLDAIGAKIANDIRAEFDSSYTDGYRNIRAVLVTVNGRPVVEQYYKSLATTSRNAYSVTKSVTATLIGIALAEGRLRGLDQTLVELLPMHAARMKPDVAGITLRQLLTMTAGLPGDPPGWPAYTARPDWVGSILREGTVRRPGTAFEYSTAGSHLLSAILVQATGQSVLDYARAKLFDPLGITTRPAVEPLAARDSPAYDAATFAWSVDPEGHHFGGSDLKLAPRDMAKLGALYLDEGRWQGRQLVPAKWVREATTAHVTFGAGPPEGYGYQWWVTTAAGDPAFAALGYGGQLIEVVPARHLVVVMSTDVNENDPGSTVDPNLLLSLVSIWIAPAVPR